MLSTTVFVVLISIAILGLGLGTLYYFKPEIIVWKRVSPEFLDSAKKDAEFRKWLDLEVQTQVRKTRKLGMIFIILEAIWIILIFSLWQKGGV